jgi:hypothetical protein
VVLGFGKLGSKKNKGIVIYYYVLSCGLDRRKKMKEEED